MAGSGKLSRKQEKLLAGLLLGKSIVDAAKEAGIAERTAYRYTKDTAFSAERTRRETALRETEEAEIQRIMTTGYAAVHERVKALDHQAREMEKPYVSPESGNTYYLRNSPEHMREWRGLLDDIAKETGGRVKKQEIEHSGLVELLAGEHASLLADLAELPNVGQVKATDTGTATGTA